MRSQKSIVSTAAAPRAAETAGAARAPQRERGRARVEALLDAGASLFAEKGFAAATMTEIAQRAGAAIGSLYQFFPSKESLADALVDRYGARFAAALEAIAAEAPELTPERAAERLVASMLALGEDRAAAVALIENRRDAADRRTRFRAMLHRQIAGILRRLSRAPGAHALPAAKREAMAAVILHLLKAVPGFAAEEPAMRRRLLAETRAAIAAYIAAATTGRVSEAGACEL
jgi:AcrR family transcriptional regulator